MHFHYPLLHPRWNKSHQIELDLARIFYYRRLTQFFDGPQKLRAVVFNRHPVAVMLSWTIFNFVSANMTWFPLSFRIFYPIKLVLVPNSHINDLPTHVPPPQAQSCYEYTLFLIQNSFSQPHSTFASSFLPLSDEIYLYARLLRFSPEHGSPGFTQLGHVSAGVPGGKV